MPVSREYEPLNMRAVVRAPSTPTPGFPFSFSGTVDVTPGGSLPVNEDALRNTTGQVIEVHEIKFSFTYGTPAGAFEAMIGITRPKGDTKVITQSPIPVSLLGVRRGLAADRIGSDYTSPTYSTAYAGHQVWRVDQPFYLLPGEGVKATLSSRSLVSNTTRVGVTISGKIGARLPSRRWLPFVTSWIAQPIDFATSTAIPGQASNERHLVNPLKAPLRVTRFLGTLGTLRNGVYSEGGNQEPVDATEQYLTMTMRSNAGTPNVRFPTPFGRVFDPISKSWECQHDLPPGGYYIVTLAAFTAPALTPTQIIPMIAMHGVREDKP